MKISEFLADFQRTLRGRDARDADVTIEGAQPAASTSQASVIPVAANDARPSPAISADAADPAPMVEGGQDVAETQAALEVAQAGLTAARKIVAGIGARLNQAAAMEDGRAAVNDDIAQLKDRLRRLVETAAFAGQNWLALRNGDTPEIRSLSMGAPDEATGADAPTVELNTADFALISDDDARDGILTRPYDTAAASAADSVNYHLLGIESGAGQDDSSDIAVDDDQSADDIKMMGRAVNAMLSDIAGASGRLSAAVEQLSGGGDPYLQGVAGAIGSGLDQSATNVARRSQLGLSSQGLNLANADSQRFSQQFA